VLSLPEEDKPTLIERVALAVLRQAFGGIAKGAERFIKRAIRIIAVTLAGVVIAVLGVAFLSIGAVKWLSALMPNWLAWAMVGVVLFLVGIILAMSTFVGSRG
jgi:hypothetical protein